MLKDFEGFVKTVACDMVDMLEPVFIPAFAFLIAANIVF